MMGCLNVVIISFNFVVDIFLLADTSVFVDVWVV